MRTGAWSAIKVAGRSLYGSAKEGSDGNRTPMRKSVPVSRFGKLTTVMFVAGAS